MVWYDIVQYEHKDPEILVRRPNVRGIPEIIVPRILVFSWPFGPLIPGVEVCFPHNPELICYRQASILTTWY